MLNSKKILILIAASALGLSACGKDNYNGQYTGSEIKIPQAQPSGSPSGYGGYGGYSGYMGYGYQQQYRAVTANLSHSGAIVTGQYDIVNNYGTMTGTSVPSGSTGMTESYRLEASAKSANRLEDVRLIPMNSYSGYGCVLTGSLDAVEDGARLQGTLNPVSAGYQTGSMLCMPTQITLDRTGSK